MIVAPTREGPRIALTRRTALAIADTSGSLLDRRDFTGSWFVRLVGEAAGRLLLRIAADPSDPSDLLRIEALRVEDLRDSEASLVVTPVETRWEGPADVWKALPRVFETYEPGQERLVLLDDQPGTASVAQLPDDLPFRPSEYGLAIIGVPRSHSVIVGARGESNVLLHWDSRSQQVLQEINLPGPVGQNAHLKFDSESALWLVCGWGGDVILRLDVSTGEPLGEVHVALGGVDHIADLAFSPSLETTAIALGASGTVVGLDIRTFTFTHQAETDERLQEIVMLDEGRFAAQPSDSERVLVGDVHESPYQAPTEDPRLLHWRWTAERLTVDEAVRRLDMTSNLRSSDFVTFVRIRELLAQANIHPEEAVLVGWLRFGDRLRGFVVTETREFLVDSEHTGGIASWADLRTLEGFEGAPYSVAIEAGRRLLARQADEPPS